VYHEKNLDLSGLLFYFLEFGLCYIVPTQIHSLCKLPVIFCSPLNVLPWEEFAFEWLVILLFRIEVMLYFTLKD
jgi:hypothetical protein